MNGILTWWKAGMLLGAAFFLTVLLVKPIGVSTQFVIFDAMLWDLVEPSLIVASDTVKSGFDSTNAYLAKSGGKYAAAAANPLNYSFIFVLATMFGAWLSSRLGGDRPDAKERVRPAVWVERFGANSSRSRYVTVFIAGFIVLYGARLAGGCTSGHMMSGMMQTAVSGYLFTLGLLITAVPLAMVLYNKGGNK
ncbi:MAG: hypothetical protein COY40_06955 [Alphaproteobacteria bacterium CG_4_10_14_0_8_um_filter_53_9]|nr:MAG: hypothetical protein COY40_06955 [Alphaproteobacteria bacterium CG_4_10_14_0_8_um_filter_53_9]